MNGPDRARTFPVDEDQIEEIIERLRLQELEAQLRVRELEVEGLTRIIHTFDASAEDRSMAIARRKNLVEECEQIRRFLMRRDDQEF